MGDPQVSRKKFPIRPGVVDTKGKDYEDIFAALLAFKLATNNDLESFTLSYNHKHYGKFDDAVLESIDKSKIHAIQLKHKKNSTKAVTGNMLGVESKGFNLKIYFDSYKDIKEKYKNANLNYYLYTNAKFLEPSQKFRIIIREDKKKKDNKKELVVSAHESLLSDNDLFNTSDNKFAYQFEINESINVSDSEITEYKDFFDHFFFYSNQKNVDDMKSYALDLFQKEYFCEKSSFDKYMEFIIKWRNLDVKENDYLDKELVSFKIGECLLKPLAINVPLSIGNSSKFGVLQQAFLHFDATILQTDEKLIKKEILTEIFGQISNVDANKASEVAAKFFIETRENLPFDKLDEDQKITVLWYMNKLPLIIPVDGNKNILKQAEKFCHGRKLIFIGHINRSDCQNLQIFQNLQDLPNDSSMYKEIVQKTKISLQGRQATSLEDLIRNYEEIKEAFTPLDLMNTTDGYLRIGEDKEELPHPYINQFLPKYVIDFEFLKQNNSESLSVISANQKLDFIKDKVSGIKLITVEEFLKEDQSEEVEESNESFANIKNAFDMDTEKIKHFERFVLVAEDQCSLEDFRKICDKSPSKSCHHFYIDSDNNMELIRSNGSIEDLKSCKFLSNYISEGKSFASFNSKINLITAKPGMGKTVLLNYLKNNIPSNYWVVNISLREHCLFFSEEHGTSEILDYFLKDQAERMKYNKLAIKIRNIFQSKGNLVFLWDGLDELRNILKGKDSKRDQTASKNKNCIERALKAIDYLSNLGFINWITAREHLQPMLEAEFKVFALTIKEMEQEDQKSFIKKRLEATYSEEKLEEFTQKIMKSVKTTEGVSFLGIPFHIYILTELFLTDGENYNKLLNSTFTLADMIEHSVEEKFDFYYKIKHQCDTNIAVGGTLEEYIEDRISQYETVALKTFLSSESIVENLHINCQQLLTRIRNSKDDFGIIVGINDDDRPIFVHNIYGEYFVASWMTKNLKFVEGFKDFFFEEAYRDIRLIFDMILAKDCPAHLAVLHNNFSSLCKNSNEIKEKDKAGRSPLHLVCSWGEKRPVLLVEKEEDLLLIDDSEAKAIKVDSPQYRKILDFLIETQKCDSFEKDNLFQWDCVEYATNSQCLLAVEVLAGNQNLQISSLLKYNECTIWYYGIRFRYTKLLEKMETVPYIELKGNRNNLLHEAVSYRRNKCLEKLFTNPIYLQHINKKNDGRVFVSQTESVTSLFPGHLESEAGLLVKRADLELKKEDNAYNVYKVIKQAPLHIAAGTGNCEAIEILLKRGADINITDNCKCSALLLAILSQHLDVVKLLIEKGASTNQVDDFGFDNLLLMAAGTGNCELIEYILQQNVPLQRDKFYTSPLDVAVIMDHMDALQILFEHVKSLREKTSLVLHALMIAIEKGRVEMVKYLVKNGIDDVNRTDPTHPHTNMTLLHRAVAFGQLEIIRFLIENKASINISHCGTGATPLHLAAIKGDTKIVQLLVQKEADLNLTCNEGYTPLFYAVASRNLESARILIDNNANKHFCDRLGRNLVYMAAVKNDLRMMEMLLNAGVDCNQTDNTSKYSALTMSIYLKHKEIYEFLIKNSKKYKLNLDVKSNDGYTALYHAMVQGDEQMTKLLLENGASTTIKFECINKNIVHYAARFGNVEILKLLIEHNADINLPDQKLMMTPLHVAIFFGNTDCASMLLRNGANLSAKDVGGRIPRQIAARKGFHELCQLIDSFVGSSSMKSENKVLHNKTTKRGREDDEDKGDTTTTKLIAKSPQTENNPTTNTM